MLYEKELTEKIIKAAIQVHRALGPGFRFVIFLISVSLWLNNTVNQHKVHKQGSTFMPASRKKSATTRKFEKAAQKPEQPRYVLRLYVTGITPKSTRAITNIKAICEQYLKGRYRLEVIDVYQQPTLARGDQIIALPTLIRKLPHPLRRLVGDLSNTDRVLLGLDLRDFEE